MSDDLLEIAKKKAAFAAVDEYIHDHMIVGIGSGSTVIYAVERLKERVQKENLKIICVPSSFQSSQLIIENGLEIGNLSNHPEIDVDIDGADEVDIHLNLIKGGGGCHTQEKILAANSKKLIIVADYRKESKTLGENWKRGIPIELLPVAHIPIMKKLEKMGGKPILRVGKTKKAGPILSDNGMFIIDVDFGLISEPSQLEHQLKTIPGIIDTGLFIGMAEKVYFGQPDGTVKIKTKQI